MNHILILTGVSGSGKSTAVKALEDIDFYCVDNLPPALIPDFIELCVNSGEKIDNIAIVIDIRIPDKAVLKEFDRIIEQIKEKSLSVKLLFLDSDDDVLLRRFKETRRRHLLAPHGDIREGIKKERELLSGLKSLADISVDTSGFNPHQLREHIQNRFSNKARELTLNFISFGFKYGIPIDADILIDVRFIPNPNFVEELRNLDGENKKVKDYVLENKTTERFLDSFGELLDFLIPKYREEGKAYLNIAIGCTGGRHRSVAIINRLAEMFRRYNPSTKHRDISRES